MEFNTNDGVRIYYLDEGQGIPLVFVHGFPLNHTNWLQVIDLLREEGRIITLDLRGHGVSDSPGSIYSMKRFADDLKGLLDHLQVQRAVLIGHSMGGYISLRFAREYPERLAGLGLVSTQAHPDSPERKSARYDSAKAVASQGPIFAAQSLPEKYTSQPDIQAEVRQIILNTPANGIIGALMGMAERDDSTPYLPSIRVPTLVVAGSDDVLIAKDLTLDISLHIPEAEYLEVPGAGHMVMMEAPTVVAGGLKKLIQDVKKKSFD